MEENSPACSAQAGRAPSARRRPGYPSSGCVPAEPDSSGIVEGLNYKIKLTIRKVYGYRELKGAEIAIYRALGKLPEPELTHRFC